MEETGMRSNLAGALLKRLPVEGSVQTAVPGLSLYRSDRTTKRMAAIYDPCIIIVAQGAKKGYLGREIFHYNEDNYLVLTLPLPMECQITEAGPEKPFLSMGLTVDCALLGEIVSELSEIPRTEEKGRCINSSPLNREISNAALRLLAALDSPDDCRILAPLRIREIYYLILKGNQGDRLLSVRTGDYRINRINRVIELINTRYGDPLTVDEMASAAGMSLSSFHQHFKEVTYSSPLRYLKTIRLHRARQLILTGDFNCGHTARQVGYESPSQFSREFKRLFGISPMEQRRSPSAGREG